MANKNKNVITVQQNPEAPVETKVMAQTIVDISTSVKRLLAGGLNKRAIVILLSHSTNLYQSQVEKVLNGLENMKKDFTTL